MVIMIKWLDGQKRPYKATSFQLSLSPVITSILIVGYRYFSMSSNFDFRLSMSSTIASIPLKHTKIKSDQPL